MALIAAAALAAATAVAAWSAGPAIAGETPGPGPRVSEAPGNGSSYWTPERMESATPADLLVEGGQPGEDTDQGGDLGLRNHPISFTRFELPETTAFPARLHGRVFFSIGINNFSCSGTVVTTPGQSAVLTAGHCVFDPPTRGGTGFVENWTFVPGYRDPDGTGVGDPPLTPFGTFGADALLAPVQWTSSGAVAFDFGGAILGQNGDGDVVEQLTGARGIAFNQPRNQSYRSFGYPARIADGFDGSRLYACDSRFGGGAPLAIEGPLPMALGCDMTGGASGGGWVARNRFVESVNSFIIDSHPDVLYGPHLEKAARNLYGPRGLRGWRCRGRTPTMVGTSAGETIVGTGRRDVIFAHGGKDTVRAGGGRDLVCGAGGRDVLKGGKGRDVLSGGPGRRDLCSGGPGDDRRAAGCERGRSL